MLSYTSGTTGNPKGVQITHKAIMIGANACNLRMQIGTYPIAEYDVHMSYLPLAHVFDRLGVHSLISRGGKIGFFGGIIHKITDDL